MTTASSRRVEAAGQGLYGLVWACALLGAAPYLAARSLARPREMRERFGLWPRDLPAPGGLWLHAASLGEVRGALPLLRGLAALGEAPLVTVVTPAARRLEPDLRAGGARAVHHAPLDHPLLVRRVLDRVSPRALLVCETEVWPGLLGAARARRVPVAFLNARLTEPGLRRWAGARRWTAALLADVRVAAQTEVDADRWRALGAPPEAVRITGNTKYDRPRGPLGERARAAGRGGWRHVIVFGSVRSAEAETVGEALRAAQALPGPAIFVLAPRHRDRGARIAEVAARALPARLRRSKPGLPLLPDVGEAAAVTGADRDAPRVLLHLDTVGELRDYYALADVAFVGATLCPIGGHNLFEAAELATPVLYGPHVANVADAAAALERTGGGRRVTDGPELGRAIVEMCASEETRSAAAAGALEAAATLGGAVERTLAALRDWGILPERE